MATNLTVANTILEQMGGRRFAVMTGAKNFVGSDRALSFRLPSNFATDGINAIRVELTPADTYTVTFSKVRGTKVTTIHEVDDVYCDVLADVISRRTGLALSL